MIQALYTFEELRQNFIEIETVRAEKGRAEGQHCRVRPDLRASMQMRVDGLRVNTNHYIGSVPGIRIGDHFWYRIEMVIVGLHQQLEAGIAYIGKGNSPIEGVPLATSVVMKHSGNPYQDDNESGDIITYTGQGGLSHRSSGAHSVTDQVLHLSFRSEMYHCLFDFLFSCCGSGYPLSCLVLMKTVGVHETVF